MSVYQIDYDLRQNRDYQALYERIQSYGTWCRPLESTWVISTQQTAVEVRHHLMNVMDANDGLLVSRLSGEAAWYGLKGEVSDYLLEQLNSQAA